MVQLKPFSPGCIFLDMVRIYIKTSCEQTCVNVPKWLKYHLLYHSLELQCKMNKQ